jgi:hypothetical protein
MPERRTPQQAFSATLGGLHRAFDATSTWVTQLSWWKFFLFAILSLWAASILQNELFSSDELVEIKQDSKAKKPKSESNIVFDDSGIRYSPPKRRGRDGAADREDEPAALAEPPADPMQAPATPAAPPVPPVKPAAPAKGAKGAKGASTPDGEVQIDLPPQIAEGLSNAIEAAIEDAAEQKTKAYQKKASTWFKSFVTLLVLALLAMKALVGGKKRAEAETQTANAAAERESMQRQLSEARMQMMQAQVEPHFLFNTLASVEFLIETNAPRAAAMQRSLIQYLRAVLPQMRDNAVITNLGREVDMVKAYLNLLKMRMEERLTVEMDVPEELRDAAFPPMMLQSTVENAIKHGLECKPEGGTLTVRAEVVGDKLRVIVTDDGVGFGVVPSNGTGLGLMTIRERLKLLHGDEGQLRIARNEPTGVVATIEVPYRVSA